MASLSAEVSRSLHQTLVAGWAGPDLDPGLERLLEAGLGGVILHSRNVTDAGQLRTVLARMRELQPDLIVTVDQEGGRIGHLARAGTPPTPGAWALGVLDDPDTTAAVAYQLGAHLAELGVNSSWSPVADVQADPRNPIIRTRSFGSDPVKVSMQVRAWVEGTARASVATAAKHFPGHGNTALDSHLGTAVDSRSLDELLASDLLPFREAIAAGVPQVMTTHVRFPAIDDRPATLSAVLVRQLLREELGFDGVVVTDALEMKAIADTVGIVPGAVGALAAGHDQFCIAEPDHSLHQQVIEGLAAAVRAGQLDVEQLARSAGRVRKLVRSHVPQMHAPQVRRPQLHLSGEGQSGVLTDAGMVAARRVVRLTSTLPSLRTPCVVDLYRQPRAVLEWDRSDLATLVVERVEGAIGQSFTFGEGVPEPSAPEVAKIVLASAQGRSLVLATQDPELHQWQAETLALLRTSRPDLVHVETGLPLGGEQLATCGRGVANLLAGAEVLAAACQ